MLAFLLSAVVWAGSATALGTSRNPDPVEAAADAPQGPAGTLVIDARLPCEVLVDGDMVARLFRAGRFEVPVPAGKHDLRVYINGDARDLVLVVPAEGSAAVFVGRTGLSATLSAQSRASAVEAGAPVALQVRVSGTQSVRLLVDKDRWEIPAGEQLEIPLSAGDHAVSVRSGNGTVIWAAGTLSLTGPEPVVLQLSEGRVPEVSGMGQFASNDR